MTLSKQHNLHGWKAHSQVGSEESLWLYTLEEGFPNDKITEGLTPFPSWVDPRGIFHLNQSRWVFPVVYNSEKEESSWRTGKFEPLGPDYPVDQSLFTLIGSDSKALTREERVKVLLQVTECYPSCQAKTGENMYASYNDSRTVHTIETEKFLSGTEQLKFRDNKWRVLYFSSPKPFIIYSTDPAKAIWLNIKNSIRTEASETINIDGINSLYVGFPEFYPKLRNLAESNFRRTIRSEEIGMSLYDLMFGGNPDNNSEAHNLNDEDPDWPGCRRVGNSYHIFHRSTTMFQGRSVYFSGILTENKIISTATSNTWLEFKDYFYDDDPLIVGKEISRYKDLESISLRKVISTNGETYSTLDPFFIPYRGSLRVCYTKIINSSSSNYEQTHKVQSWAPLDESPLWSGTLTAFESTCDYLFSGEVLENPNRKILFDISTEGEVVSEVCVPVSVYLNRIPLRRLSQLQIGMAVTRAVPSLPLGYVVPHPLVKDSDTYEYLGEIYKSYALTSKSRKTKEQQYRDIEETVHELAKTDIKEYVTNYSTKQAVSFVENPILVSKAANTVVPLNLSITNQVLQGVTVGSYMRTGFSEPWVGRQIPIGNEIKISTHLDWILNLYLLGRVRGNIVMNPETSPIISTSEMSTILLYNIPKIPASVPVTDKDTEIEEIAESLWGLKEAV
jgi:hypothetical protein